MRYFILCLSIIFLQTLFLHGAEGQQFLATSKAKLLFCANFLQNLLLRNGKNNNFKSFILS